MVIERFQNGEPSIVGDRFKKMGRMMPDDVKYVSSWMSAEGDSCFQLMEAADEGRLQPWMDAWSDLVDFEVVPVVTSDEFWKARGEG